MARHRAAHLYRDGIADVPHRVRASSEELVPVGEGLNPGRFPHRHVAKAAIGVADHCFAAADAMHSGLDRLGWPVDGATGVSWIGARTRDAYVIQPSASL